KFPPFVTAPNGDSHPHKFPYFRLAEMFMIKAEALNEQGNTAGAIAILNRLRARVFDPDKPLAANLSPQEVRQPILDERPFEFAGEAKRRQDMIRLGGFTAARPFKNATEGYRVLMPLPITQIQNHPLLGAAGRGRDLFPLGALTAARQFKNAPEGYRVLMPLPITQLQNNPLLTHNAGY